jgi:hypothetical protein
VNIGEYKRTLGFHPRDENANAHGRACIPSAPVPHIGSKLRLVCGLSLFPPWLPISWLLRKNLTLYICGKSTTCTDLSGPRWEKVGSMWAKPVDFPASKPLKAVNPRLTPRPLPPAPSFHLCSVRIGRIGSRPRFAQANNQFGHPSRGGLGKPISWLKIRPQFRFWLRGFVKGSVPTIVICAASRLVRT